METNSESRRRRLDADSDICKLNVFDRETEGV